MILEFAPKLLLLCELAETDTYTFQYEFRQLHGVHKSITDRWLAEDAPTIHMPTRQKFIQYWRAHPKQKTHIPDAFWTMSLRNLRLALEARNETQPALAVRVFPAVPRVKDIIGTYQVIRPHSFEERRYVLEVMQITTDEAGEPRTLMYSHTQVKQALKRGLNRYLYQGQGHSSPRYYSSLLTRENETDSDLGAFRCVQFYAGADMATYALSGLMLRGVTASWGGKQAVAVPIIALRVTETPDLMAPDFVPLNSGLLWRLHADGHVLIGEVGDDKRYVGIFRWCDSVWKEIEKNEWERSSRRGRRSKTPRSGLLHTVAPISLDQVTQLEFGQWRKVVGAALDRPIAKKGK